MKRIDWKRVLTVLTNLLRSILRGDLVLKLDRLLPHILVFVVFVAVSIWATMKFETTMVTREKNKTEIAEIKIYYSQKVLELSNTQQIRNIDALIKKNSLTVGTPDKPAVNIE